MGYFDMRSLPEQGIAVIPSGFSWFAYAEPQDICLSGCRHRGVLVGTSLDDTIENAASIESLLKVRLDAGSTTPALVLTELVTLHGDPMGETAWKPVLSGRLLFGGREVATWRHWKYADANPTYRALALGVFQEDYRRLRAADIDRGSEHYKRVLSKWAEDYGLDYREFIPSDLPDEGVLPHETDLNDTFTDTGGTGLTSHTGDDGQTYTLVTGGGTDWEITASGDAITGPTGSGGGGLFRASTALSTANQYGELDFYIAPSGGDIASFALRVSASADTAYWNWWRFVHRLYKRVTGTNTQIGTDIDSHTGLGSSPRVARMEIEDSDVYLYYNGSLERTTTDASITGNVNVGLYLFQSDDDDAEADDWNTGDFSTGAPDPTPAAPRQCIPWGWGGRC